MTCRYIYSAALALIGESEDTDATKDYAARSKNLLTLIFLRYSSLSEALSGGFVSLESMMIPSLDSPFPLDERLAALSAEALASMLIIDELPEISKNLAERAEFDRQQLCLEASTVGSTREVYGS